MSKKVIFYGVMYLYMFSSLLHPAVVVLNGTSCAGKSTISNCILEKSGIPCHYISVDDIEDSLKKIGNEDNVEKRARLIAYTQAKKEALAGTLVVLDVCILNSKELEILQKIPVIHFLVYAPFHVLMERDRQRTEKLKRDEGSRKAALGFIIECFCKLYRRCVIGEKPVGSVNRLFFQSSFRDYLRQDNEDVYSYVREQVQEFSALFF